MRRGFVFVTATATVLTALSWAPTFAQPPAATPAPTVQPLPAVPTAPPPGTTVVVPGQPVPAGTTVVVPTQPAPAGTVVVPTYPAPAGTTVVVPTYPAPAGTVVVPGPAAVGPAGPYPGGAVAAPPHPVYAAGPVQPFRFVPPLVHVPIPGPIVYGPGPFLTSRYNPVAGPPYALPDFAGIPVPTTVTVVPTQVRVSYATGRTSQITVAAAGGQTFPADVRVTEVRDTANAITWDVKSVSTSPDRRTLTVTLEGRGLTKTGARPPEGGNLSITLGGSGTLPRVDPLPVVYVTPQ
jgi:hypothetical protein